MTDKEPVLLTVWIDPAQLQWHVAGIDLAGRVTPLVCSAPGNLRPYLGAEPDEQANFLRHRLCGVLQRGCDRLWGRRQKPCHVALVATAPFESTDPALTARVAEHFVEWMTRPPVAFFLLERSGDQTLRLARVAGEIDPERRQALDAGLPALLRALDHLDQWELTPPSKEPRL